MGTTFSKHGDIRNAYKILVDRPQGNILFGRTLYT
jgi:hypothetical protein